MNFFDILYAKKNSDALSANFFDLLFARATTFDVWDTYEGTLPAQFSANGDNLKAYKVWGNTGGVGKETTNLWDLTVKDFEDSEITTSAAKGYIITGLKPNTNYTMSTNLPKMSGAVGIWFGGTNSQSNGVAEGQNKTKSTDENGEIYVYYRTDWFSIYDDYWYMLNEGATAESYVPYGYEVDVETQENLWNSAATTWSPDNRMLDDNGNVASSLVSHYSTNFTRVDAQTTYYIYGSLASNSTYRVYYYDSAKQWIQRSAAKDGNEMWFTTPSNTAFIQIQVYMSTDTTNWVISEKSTIPGKITTPIYIGTPALEKDEYIDSESGKVYRRTEQLWDGAWLQGGINTSTGEIDDRTTYVHTNPIPCQDINKMLFKYFGVAHDGVVKIIYRGTYGDEWLFARWQDSGNDFEGFSLDVSYAKSLIFSFSAAESGEDISPETAEQLLLMDTDEAPTAETAYIPYLQPTDPPVPIPAIPTVDGSTIIEVDSAVQPEKVYFEYKKR